MFINMVGVSGFFSTQKEIMNGKDQELTILYKELDQLVHRAAMDRASINNIASNLSKDRAAREKRCQEIWPIFIALLANEYNFSTFTDPKTQLKIPMLSSNESQLDSMLTIGTTLLGKTAPEDAALPKQYEQVDIYTLKALLAAVLFILLENTEKTKELDANS